MSRTERTKHRVAVLLPALALAAGALVAAALFAPPPAFAASGETGTAAAPALAPEAEALLERYSAEGLAESVLLRPRAEGTAVRSIEIDDDGSVLVNGKEFDVEELVTFLGEDGRRLAELAELDADARRSALGLEAREAPAGRKAEPGARITIDVPGIPPIPPIPPVPDMPAVPGIHVRASRDDRVSVGHSIHVGEGETAHDVICVGCSVDVDGEVFGSVVAIGGSARVQGTVHEGAVAVGGSVNVSSKGVVQGEAVAVGGTVDVEEGGQVLGQRSSVGVGGPWFGGWGEGFGVFGDVGRLVKAIFKTGLLTLLGVLLYLAMRPAVERAARRVREEPWKAIFAGLMVQLLILPVLVLVTVILAVSIIGIPLLALVPVAILAFVIAALLGFVGVGLELGRWVERITNGHFSSSVLAVIVGIVLIQATALLGRLLSLPSGWVAVVGFSIVLLGFFLKYVAWTLGMGAMTLVAFSREWRRRRTEPEIAEAAVQARAEPVEAPPPPPPADPVA